MTEINSNLVSGFSRDLQGIRTDEGKNKLSSGVKKTVDDQQAATFSISARENAKKSLMMSANRRVAEENMKAANAVKDVTQAQELLGDIKAKMLAKPDESTAAQANQVAARVAALIQ